MLLDFDGVMMPFIQATKEGEAEDHRQESRPRAILIGMKNT
jgi:hypothetical protein